jgi:hypothetical protein
LQRHSGSSINRLLTDTGRPPEMSRRGSIFMNSVKTQRDSTIQNSGQSK